MSKSNTLILDEVRKIEQDLQALKAQFYLRLPKKEKKAVAFYKDEVILKEVKKVRKKLWNEKYSKVA